MYPKKFQTIRSTNLDITISIFYTHENPKSAMKLPMPYRLNAPNFKLSKEEKRSVQYILIQHLK